MGLLDDAIREHLELKRRAGADAMDVARQEREALGAGGRSDPLAMRPPEEDDPYAEVSFATPAPVGHYEGPYDDEPGDDEDYYYEDEEEAHTPPPAVTSAPPPPAQAAPPPPPPPVPVQAPPQPQPPAPPAGPATEEFRLPPAEAESPDVLEQTPDFLQETPEHDRLWFEQAPAAGVRLRQVGPRLDSWRAGP